MPVQVAQIPNFQGQAINAPEMSARAAAAPAIALGSLAQSIASVSNDFAGQAQQIQKVENARIISENRNRISEEYANFQVENQRETDPEKRMANNMAFLQKQSQTLDQPGFSPYVRAALTSHFDDFATRARSSATEDAANLTVKRAGLALSNELEAAALNNDPEGHRKALDTAVESGIILPEQRIHEEMRFAKISQDRAITDSIIEDPDLWLQENPSPAEGQAPAEWEKYRSFAKSQFREETAETAGQIQDGIASGSITTPEEIDALASNLRPTALATLKNVLADRSNEVLKAKLRDPAYQNQLLGQASAMVKSYDPNGEDFDSGYVAVDSIIRQLAPSAIRDELEKNLKDKRNGEETRIKTHAQEARAALEDHFDAIAKKIPSAEDSYSTTRAINDGLLRDPKKLTALGFNEEQVEQIIGKDDDTNSARKSRFREMSVYRDGAVTAGPWTTAASEAILNGKESFAVLNPEAEGQRILAQRELDKSRGKSLRTLTDWLTTTGKNATEDQINSKIQELAGKDARVKLQSGFFEPKNEAETTPKGADPSTSSVPIGKDISTVVKHFEAGGVKEGFHRAAYWDYGQWSIGYGTKAKKGEVIDQAEAERRLSSELSSHRTRVEAEAQRLGLSFKPHEIDALTSFDYNTGAIDTLLANGTRSKAEIAEKMLLYIKADGSKLEGLERRRAAERQIFLNGYLAANND